MYGVSSGSGIFQRTMEELLAGIPFVIVQVDDILILGRNDVEDYAVLQELLQCIFLADEVTFCGQRICKASIQPVKDKVKEIK